MFAVKLKGQIILDRQLWGKLPKDIEPSVVEIIVLHEPSPEPAKTAKKSRRHAGRKAWAFLGEAE